MRRSTEGEEPMLGPLRDDYKATAEDRARVWAKLRAAALTRGTAISETPAAPRSSRRPRWTTIAAPTCAFLALIGLAHYGLVGGSTGGGAGRVSNAPGASAPGSVAPNSSDVAKEDAPAFAARDGAPAPAPRLEAPAPAECGGAVAVNTLPSAQSEVKTASPRPSSSQPRAAAGSVSPLPAERQTAKAAPIDTLEEETRLLAAAARAVRAGAGAQALASAQEHARRFPHGELEDERDVQRILALCLVGQTDEATRHAQRLLSGRPPSALTRRVEQSCIRR